MVTVLMPVYNGEQYLKEAIQSILAQTFTDFEFLIINDASTDNTKEIIKSFNDPRIVYVENERNLGLTESLNKGLTLAKGEYIARMDADDWSFPCRLEYQIHCFRDNPQLALVGSSGFFVNEDTGREKLILLDISSERLFTELFFNNTFIHSSVMYKKEVVDSFLYNPNIRFAQDYYLWSQILKHYQACNLKEPLIKYRIHNKGISVSKKFEQDFFVKETQKLHLSYLGIENLTESQISTHFNLIFRTVPKNRLAQKEIDAYMAWIIFLRQSNTRSAVYDKNYFNQRLTEYWFYYFPLLLKCKFRFRHLDWLFDEFSRSVAIKRKFKILVLLVLNHLRP